MSVVELVQRYVVAAVVVSFGVGAGLATVILGVPKMWTAEAAGWASAVGAIAAVFAALYLAGASRRQQQRDQAAAGRLAFLALWPNLHRAQARTAGIASSLQSPDVVTYAGVQEQLARDIDGLEVELTKIGAAAGVLDHRLALRVMGAVALSGYVARQARRLIEPSSLTIRAKLWKDCGPAWVGDAQKATGQLLSLSVESEAEANLATGRTARGQPTEEAST